MGKIVSGALVLAVVLYFGSLISKPGDYVFVPPCDSAEWFTSTSMPHNSSHNVVLHDYLGDTNVYYIIGGYMNDTITNEVLRFVSGPDTYDTVTPNLPLKLSNGFGFTLGDSLYYGGGYTPGWETQTSPVIDSLFDVTYSSGALGFIGTTSGRILQTTDTGSTWPIKILESTARKIRSIKFISSTTGWALASSDSSLIYRTTNSGVNWLSAPPILTKLNKLDFDDPLTGWAGGNSNAVYKSTNGGATWTLSPTGLFQNINCVSAIGTTNLWGACDSGKVLRTTNGGTSWSEIAISSQKLNTIKFINSSTGFAGGEGGAFHRTIDSGATWQPISLGTTIAINDIENPSGTTILVSGNNGNIFVSTNAGANWTRKRGVTNRHIKAIAAEGGSGLATIIGSAGYITHSTAGYFDGVISKKLFKICVSPMDSVWSEKDSLPVPIAGVFSNAEELNDSLAYIVGGRTNSNVTVSTTYRYNGKTDNWTTATPLPDSLYEGGIGFISDTTLFFVGGRNNAGISDVVYRGTVKISIGQPDTIVWSADTTYPGGQLFGMGTAGVKTVGAGIVIGGSSNQFPEYPTLMSYIITDDDICAVPLTVPRSIARPAVTTGTDGCKLDSKPERIPGSDTLYYEFRAFGGIEDSLSTSNNLNRVLSVKDITISVQNISTEIPMNFDLGQNYPNPFNPATSIQYKLPHKEMVSLKIYDITGRLVSVVVNTIQDAGTYMVRYSNPALASGVYIYTIEAGSYKSAKYMVLLK